MHREQFSNNNKVEAEGRRLTLNLSLQKFYGKNPCNKATLQWVHEETKKSRKVNNKVGPFYYPLKSWHIVATCICCFYARSTQICTIFNSISWREPQKRDMSKQEPFCIIWHMQCFYYSHTPFSIKLEGIFFKMTKSAGTSGTHAKGLWLNFPKKLSRVCYYSFPFLKKKSPGLRRTTFPS